jgi:hypothetical protein
MAPSIEPEAWRSCPTQIDEPLQVFGVWTLLDLGLAIGIFFGTKIADILPYSGLAAVAAAGLFLWAKAAYNQAVAPQYLLHLLHALELLPQPAGFLRPRAITYSVWGS